MFTSTEEVADFISEQNIELVDVRFCDVPGVQQHFTIPVSEFLDAALSDGLMFDGSSVRGFTAIHESDMKLIPDISSAFVDPFRDRKTLVVNFSIVDPFTDEPFSRDPRQVAAKAEAYLRSTGIADECFIGAEAEFYLFDDVRYQVSPAQHLLLRRLPRGVLEHGTRRRGRQHGLQGAHQGRLLPRLPRRQVRGRARRDEPPPRGGRPDDRARPPRGRLGRPAGDQLPLRDAADRGRRHDEVQVRHQELRPRVRSFRDLHAQAPVRRQRLGHAHAHVAVEERRAPVLRRARLRLAVRHGALVHRRPA